MARPDILAPGGDGMDASALLNEVVAVPRQATTDFEETTRIERPGWLQVVTPSFKMGGLNEVSFAVLSATDADLVIEQVIESYRSLSVRFRWIVSLDSRPNDLSQRLAAKGLERRDVVGMVKQIGPCAPGAQTVLVTDESVDLYTRVMAEGWHVNPKPLGRYHRHLVTDRLRRHQLFLAFYEGRPAGAAAYVRYQRSVHLSGAVVLPEFRNRGLYRSLTNARLAHAAASGLAVATTHANEATSAAPLERMGFSAVCRFPIFYGP